MNLFYRHRAEDLRQLLRSARICLRLLRLGYLQRLQHPGKVPLRRGSRWRGRHSSRRWSRGWRNRSGWKSGSSRKCARRRRFRLSRERCQQVILRSRRRSGNRAEDPGCARSRAIAGPFGRSIRGGSWGVVRAVPERVHVQPPYLEKSVWFRNPRLHRLGLTVKGGQPTIQAHLMAARSGQVIAA